MLRLENGQARRFDGHDRGIQSEKMPDLADHSLLLHHRGQDGGKKQMLILERFGMSRGVQAARTHVSGAPAFRCRLREVPVDARAVDDQILARPPRRHRTGVAEPLHALGFPRRQARSEQLLELLILGRKEESVRHAHLGEGPILPLAPDQRGDEMLAR